MDACCSHEETDPTLVEFTVRENAVASTLQNASYMDVTEEMKLQVAQAGWHLEHPSREVSQQGDKLSHKEKHSGGSDVEVQPSRNNMHDKQ